MKHKELVAELDKVFKDVSGYGPPDIEITHRPEEHELTIKLSRMYEYVDVTFDHLARIAEILGTRVLDINEDEKNSYPGCETCDHGSSYELYIHARRFYMKIES